MLELKNIKKSFGGTEVLKNVGLSVSKGDVVAILGPSGSGKTTLLRIANFLETADGGEMNFEGEVLDLPKVSHQPASAARRVLSFRTTTSFATSPHSKTSPKGFASYTSFPPPRPSALGGNVLKKSAWATARITTRVSSRAVSSSIPVRGCGHRRSHRSQSRRHFL